MTMTMRMVETAASVGSTLWCASVHIRLGSVVVRPRADEQRHRHLVERSHEGEKERGQEANFDQRQGD